MKTEKISKIKEIIKDVYTTTAILTNVIFRTLITLTTAVVLNDALLIMYNANKITIGIILFGALIFILEPLITYFQRIEEEKELEEFLREMEEEEKLEQTKTKKGGKKWTKKY